MTKTDIGSNKVLSTKMDLVVGRDPDCVRFTIKQHHDEVNKENEIFAKEEHYVLRKQKEIQQKKLKDKMKKQQDSVKQKFVKRNSMRKFS